MILGPNKFSLWPSHDRLAHIGIALLFCVSTLASLASISVAEEQHTAGSSSKNLRKQTVKSLPFGELNQQTRDKIHSVVQKPSIYRRLPVTSIATDPDHFQFLVRHPEVIVNIWQLMGVTQMQTKRTGPYTISSNDGAGTISSIELVYGTDNLHIFYGTGTYEGPILKRKLNGSCVLVLKSESQLGADGNPTQTSQLDVFLKVDNATAGLIAKTIQPMVGTTADHNFVESLKFIQRLDQTTQKNGPGVERMSHRLDIDPVVRQEYAKVIDQVFQRAINAAAPPGNRTLRPTSLQSRPTQPPRTLEPSKFNSSYSKQSSNSPSGYPNSEAYSNQGLAERSSNAIPLPSKHRPTPVPAIRLNGSTSLPARGYQAPSYVAPTVTGYSGYGYQAPTQSEQVRQQAYSEYQSQYGPRYNAAHAYRQYPEPSRNAAVQATHYQQYENHPSGAGPIQTVGGWRGR